MTVSYTHLDVYKRQASNHDLLAHSRPVMEVLFEQVRHTQGMVILADKRGTLMHTLGHADFLNRADRVALSCGASWQEQHRGTNAIGTALVEAGGIEIHGAEHFFDKNEFLTCTAMPVLSAQGQVMGILDISGDQRSRHAHTLGLAVSYTHLDVYKRQNEGLASLCAQNAINALFVCVLAEGRVSCEYSPVCHQFLDANLRKEVDGRRNDGRPASSSGFSDFIRTSVSQQTSNCLLYTSRCV